MPDPTLTQAIGEFIIASALHYGPGPHPDGSPQQVHGGGAEAAAPAGAKTPWDAAAFAKATMNRTPHDAQRELQRCVPGATLRQIHDAYTVRDPDSGLAARITEMGEETPGRFVVSGRITSRDGREVGEFVRMLGRETTGARTELVAGHTLFEITAEAQGHGFGMLFYQTSERAYRQMGIAAVRLHANMEVGGYAWARAGFDWAQTAHRDRLVDLAQRYWRAVSTDTSTPPFPEIKHAWELAALTHPNDLRIGKELMLGSNWTAIKYLTADSPGLRAGDAYYAEKAKKGKATK